MPRWVLLAALGAALMAMPCWAQRGGGGHGGFGGGHASFGGHGGFAHPMGGGFHGSMRPGGFSGGRWGGRPWGGGSGNGFHHYPYGGYCRGGNCFYHHYYNYGYGYGYPGYGYGYWPYAYAGWGWDYPWFDDYDDSDNYQSQAAPNDYYSQPPSSNYYAPPDYQSQAEIDRLHDEVARLRDQMHNIPRPPEPKEAAPEPTQLVFADKHTEQVENYAIVRQNLWIFDGTRTRKVPLSSLDIPATQKANENQGVDFEIPN